MIAFAVWVTPPAEAGITLEHLRCEYLTNPIGIGEPQPRLSWVVESLERGEKQTAYQILVASSEEALALDQGDHWDSGKVAADTTSQIVYGGAPLGSRTACYWKARAWNRSDQASSWSAPASWMTGLLKPSDWTAKWIDGAVVPPAGASAVPPVIVEAFYEATTTSGGSLDVTAQLAAMAAEGQYSLPVTNSTFGSDPAPGVSKRLRVVFQRNGQTSTKSFWEGAVIAFPSALTRVSIQSAFYKSTTSSRSREVTSVLQPLAAAGSFSIAVNNTNFGPDPAPGQLKQLRVNYTVDGISGVHNAPENSTFDFPDDLPGFAISPLVSSARFEAIDGAGSLDVTADLAARAQAGSYSLTVNVGTFGSDPALDHYKRLRIDYSLNGRQWTKYVAEHGVFNYPADLNSPTNIPYLRKSFTLSKPVRRAILHATALGLYEMRINGSRVGDHVLAPEWTDYSKRVRYQSYDVTSQLVAGANAIGAQVAPGWYAGHIGNGGFKYWGSSPALLAQLEVTYTDGSSERVVSDGTWKMHPGPILSGDFMHGEDHDSRKEIAGWSSPALDDSSWSAVLLRSESGRAIESQVMEPVREVEQLAARTITEPQPGKWTYDLGQNMVGVVRLKITAPAGTKITLRHAEILNPNGTIYTTNLRAAHSIDSYVCKGGGVEIWQPRFTFHGFRYVELTGVSSAPPLDAVTGIVIASDTPRSGSFACSDGWINKLQSNIEWGQRGNYLSVPTDCPQRDERLGWMGDAQVFIRTASYNSNVAAFFTKWMTDVMDSQRPDGAYADVSPSTGVGSGAPAWGDAGVICPWTIYQTYGDIRLLESNYPAMVKWVEWCKSNTTGFIRDRSRGNDYGDWLSINADTNKELIGTAYFAYSTKLLAKAAAVLGKTADAATYEALFQSIKSAFINRYVNPITGAITGNTQCAYAMALRFDLLPANLRDEVAQLLENDIVAKGDHLSTGFVGVSYLLPALTTAGKTDTAYRLLMQDTFPSWLFSVKLGATTIWERWDGWTPSNGFQDAGMNSFNHYSLGSCGEWLYGTVAGIDLDPSAPAYRKIVIRPKPGGNLTSASGSLQSIHGRISSAWHQFPGGFTLETTIPANTSAVVHVPATDAAGVKESGNAASTSDGVTFLRMEDGAAVFAVESGRYLFTTGSPLEEPGLDTVSHDPGTTVRMRISTLLANDGAGPHEFVSAGPFSIHGASVTIVGDSVRYTPQPGNDGADSFSYTIRDSLGGITVRNVRITLVAEDAKLIEAVSIERLTDGSCRVRFAGEPNRIYRIESCETPDGAASWASRVTIQADENGGFEFIDPHPLPEKRFYRAAFP